ncbi:uncharacterized protein ACB058_012259 [Synchiropus picturatus]
MEGRSKRAISAPPHLLSTLKRVFGEPCLAQKLIDISHRRASNTSSSQPRSPSDSKEVLLDLSSEFQSRNKQINALCNDVAAITKKLEDWMLTRKQEPESILQTAASDCSDLFQKVQRLHDILALETKCPSRGVLHATSQCDANDPQSESLHMGPESSPGWFLLQNMTSTQAAAYRVMEEEMMEVQREATMKQETLSREIERLKENQLIMQENFTTDLQAEKDKSSRLVKELEKLTRSHEDLVLKCETLKLQNTRIEKSLDMEMKTNKEKVENELRSYQSLRTEKEILRQKFTEEMAAMQRDASMKLESLRRELEEQKEAMMLREEKFNSELKAEKDKNLYMSQEREKISVTYKELTLKYETVEQHAAQLQETLDNEIKSHEERVQDDIKRFQSLRAEKEALRQKMAEKVAELERDATLRQEARLREVEELKETQLTNQERFSTELRAEKDKNLLLTQELEKITCSHQELTTKCDNAEHRATVLQQKLDEESKSNAEIFKENQQRFQAWRAKKEVVRQNMANQIAAMQRDASIRQQSLSREVRELKESQLFNQQNYKAELMAEKDKNLILSQELTRMMASHHEISIKLLTVEQEAESLKEKLEIKIKSHEKRLQEDSDLLHSMSLEKEALHQRLTDEMAVLQRDADAKCEALTRKLEELKAAQILSYGHPRIDDPAERDNLPLSSQDQGSRGQYEELQLRCQMAERQAILLRQKLEMEVKSKESLQQKIAENAILQKDTAKNLKWQLDNQVSLNLELSRALAAHRSTQEQEDDRSVKQTEGSLETTQLSTDTSYVSKKATRKLRRQ